MALKKKTTRTWREESLPLEFLKWKDIWLGVLSPSEVFYLARVWRDVTKSESESPSEVIIVCSHTAGQSTVSLPRSQLAWFTDFF